MPHCLLCGNPKTLHASSFDIYQPCQTPKDEPCAPCRRMGKLESQIFQTKTALAKLIEQHRELKTEISRTHNPIIHRVPPEITSSIFQFCVSELPDDISFEKLIDKSKLFAPLVLGAVCKKWREIAWSTRQLWTVIFISVDVSMVHMRLELFQQWLSRSGQFLPLSIYVFIKIFPYDPAQAAPSLYPLVELINQYSSRWRDIYLSVPSFLLPRFSGDMRGVSMLQNLVIHPTEFSQKDQTFMLEYVKPRPSSVSMSFFRFNSIKILWDDVTHVEMHSLHVDECLELLQCAPKIEYCKFTNVLPAGRDSRIPENLLVHYRLRGLHFGTTWYTSSDFFNNVTLPSLEDFLADMDGAGRFPVDVLVHLLHRSSCHLKRLRMTENAFADEALGSLLKGTTSLRELHLLSGPNTPENFFKSLDNTALMPNGNGDTLLPLLEHLSCAPRVAILEWKYILHILGGPSDLSSRSRRRPLKVVKISCNRRGDRGHYNVIDKDTLLQLLQLRNSGVDFQLTDMYDNTDLMDISAGFHGISLEVPSLLL